MIEWKLYSHEFGLEEGLTPDNGRWSINPRKEEKFVVKTSYQLGHPDGFDPFKESKTWDDLTIEERLADPEYLRIRAMCWGQDDIMTCPTVDLTKLLISRFYDEPLPSGTWLDIILAGGFKKARYGQGYDMKMPKGFMSVDVRGNDGLIVTYEERGRSHWWNLLILDPGGEHRIKHFPRPIDEINRIAAQFTVDHLVDFVKTTVFHKPQPRATKKMGDLMAMMSEVDEVLKERGHGDQRDYSRHFGFKYVDHMVGLGVSPERADVLYRSTPDDITPAEEKLRTKTRKALAAYGKKNPYRDYWHFMLEHLPDLENDINMKICFQVFADAATEDWQKEIAQIYLDKFGSKEQVVRVSW